MAAAFLGVAAGTLHESRIKNNLDNLRRNAPSAPLKGELLSEREAEGFHAQLTNKPLRFR